MKKELRFTLRLSATNNSDDERKGLHEGQGSVNTFADPCFILTGLPV